MACYLVTFHVTKKLPYRPSFFKGADIGIIVGGVDVIADLEDFFDESIRKRRRTKA